MADHMFNVKIDPNLVVFVFVASPYVDSVSDENHFCNFWQKVTVGS